VRDQYSLAKNVRDQFFSLFFFSKNGLQMMVGASFVLVMRTNFDERMFN
jgi:hypothetical protein